MRMQVFAMSALLSAAIAAPSYAGVDVGDEAPDIQVKEWIKGNPCSSLKDLRGKAILIEFFATT